MPIPRALVLRAPGINCDEETVAAWEVAGAAAESWHIDRILEAPESLDAFQILTIPGGFSYGDDLGAGRILGTRLRALADDLLAFRDRGGLVLGICNGFQALVRAGLLPGEGSNTPVTITHNDSGHFEGRWVRLLPTGGKCAFIADDEPIELPVAHGEGKFLAADPGAVVTLERSGQVVLRYVDSRGSPTQEYPANPNGSWGAVAGLCDRSGHVFGLMPHPERYVDPLHHPRWTREGPRAAGDGLRIFQSAIAALR
jgi:phosphoribosylformylglycinamidine synthase